MHKLESAPLAVIGVLLGALVVPACTGRESGTQTAGVAADPASENRFVTLTGCVKRGQAGEFTLASVATAGVLGGSEVDPVPTSEADAQLAAASSYRMIPGAEDQDFTEFENQRVTVRGRIAAEAPPTGTSGAPAGQDAATGPAGAVEVERGPTQSAVVANAPPLRGFYVESINRVADSCTP